MRGNGSDAFTLTPYRVRGRLSILSRQWRGGSGAYRGYINLMSLKGLFEILDDHPAYQRLLGDIGSGRMVHRMAAPEAAGPYLMAALWCRLGVPLLTIVPRPEDARRLHDQLLSYLGEECRYTSSGA